MLPLTSMTGQLITEMMAKETDERRVNFEPFNSLILPLPEARDIFVRVRVHFARQRIWPVLSTVRVPYGSTIDDVLKATAELELTSDAIEGEPELSSTNRAAPLKYSMLVAAVDTGGTGGAPSWVSPRSSVQAFEKQRLNVFEVLSEEKEEVSGSEPGSGSGAASSGPDAFTEGQIVEVLLPTASRGKYGERITTSIWYKAKVIMEPFGDQVNDWLLAVKLLNQWASTKEHVVPLHRVRLLAPVTVRVVLRTLQRLDGRDVDEVTSGSSSNRNSGGGASSGGSGSGGSGGYFLDPLRPVTFGRSFFIKVQPGTTTGLALHEMIWDQIRPFHENLPGERSGDPGGKGSAGFKFPFAMQAVLSDSKAVGDRPIVSDLRNARLAGDSIIHPTDSSSAAAWSVSLTDNSVLLCDIPLAARRVWNDTLLSFSHVHKSVAAMAAISGQPDTLADCMTNLVAPEAVMAHSRAKTRQLGEYAEVVYLKTQRLWVRSFEGHNSSSIGPACAAFWTIRWMRPAFV